MWRVVRRHVLVISCLTITLISFVIEYADRPISAMDHSQGEAGSAAQRAIAQRELAQLYFDQQSGGAPAMSPKDFTDGSGIYYYDQGKYNFLYWKKKLFAQGAPPEEKDLVEAAESAIEVTKGVRFFSYGLDFSKWPVVPPYFMAFCVVRDARTVEGAFPIRIKLVERTEPIYELQPPDLLADLGPNVPWAINFLYSCNDGWIFKFH